MINQSRGDGGVRVVEFAGSGIAAAYAGWLLAGMGAQVTRLVDPDCAAGRRASPLEFALEALAKGKASMRGPANVADFDALLAEADILLCDTVPDLEALAGAVNSLGDRFPRLVVGTASTFGLEGPYAGFPGVGLDAQAISGVAWSLGEPGRAPLSMPPGILEHQAGAMLAAGSLLALGVRDAGGTGGVVDIALADVLASYVGGNCRFYIHHGLAWARNGRRPSGSGGAYPYVVLPCKDGNVCVCGRTREEWNRLVAAMGNPQWAAQARYQDLRAMGTQYPEEVDRLMMPWLARHTKAELEALALEHNLIVSPIKDFAEVMQSWKIGTSDFLTSARVAEQVVSVPSLPFSVHESRTENAANIGPDLLRGCGPARTATPAAKPGGPLAGMRVLDLGWVWSAPWVSTILGELGAQVIKVEHAKRPDNSRLSGRIVRDGRVVEGSSREMSPMFHQINHGKLGITLNVKAPRAVALLKRLVAISDLVVENMSPGSLERSQLGYEDLRLVNPRLVMLAMSAAGQFGERASMRAYAPTMSSYVGLEALVGYRGEAPVGALNFALGDPNATVHGLVAVFAALRRANSTGLGCYVDLSQIDALLGTLRPYLIDSQIRGRQPPAMGNAHPDMAPHGIFPAIGQDAWLTIAVVADEQWQALTRVAAGEPWAEDARLRTLDGRLASVDALDAAIARWTSKHERDALVARLRAAGIAASPVLTIEEQWRDAHFAAREVKQAINIPVYGKEDVFKAPWRFSDFAPQISACGPTTGQHNEQVFGELLGLTSDEIAELRQSGVIA